MNNGICAFTSICEEDACWIDQWLAEAERLNMPFGVHFDRCSMATKVRIRRHPLYRIDTRQNDPLVEFTEQHKQRIFDLLSKEFRFKWLIAWDVDETFEQLAPEKLSVISLENDTDNLQVTWINLWGDKKHIRVDGPFKNAQRIKFYNLQDNRRWVFNHPITNGAKLVQGKVSPREYSYKRSDLVCLHHGLMTEELRQQKKARWDRIYSTAVGSNPYHIWEFSLNLEYPATVERHRY